MLEAQKGKSMQNGSMMRTERHGEPDVEQNLGPDRARITKMIDAFMRLIRAI
jgi:hypothetical protein